jgi:hypothetical protein
MWVNYLPIFMPNSKLEVNPQKEFCSNPNYRDYGKRDAGNIVKYGHYRNGRQLPCPS